MRLNTLNDFRPMTMKLYLTLSILGLLSCKNTSSNNEDESISNTETIDECLNEKTTLNLESIYDQDGNKLPDTMVNDSKVDWYTVKDDDPNNYSGVGRYGNCSASLIETGGNGEAPAYIITNGHCVGSSLLSEVGYVYDVNPRDLTSDHSVSTYKNMSFLYYKDYNTEDYLTIGDKRVVFASMDKTDIAIVELNASLEFLKEVKNIDAYTLATVRPNLCLPIINVGVPLTGMHSSNYGLRKSECFRGSTVALREGPYKFSDSFRHRCSIVGGNSGSPLFDANSNHIIGLVNTAVNDNTSQQENCSLNRPCEIQDQNNSVKNNENYAQYVDFIAECFDTQGKFDKNLDTCGINNKFTLKNQ